MEKKVKCSIINVEIHSGSFEYLGYNFNVRYEKTNKMKLFIILTLSKYNIPYNDIYVSNELEVPENMVWNEGDIDRLLKKEAPFIKGEQKQKNIKLIRYT